MGVSRQHIAELLAKAAMTIKEAPGIDPWDYGWCLPEYRQSEGAALSSTNGPVTMTPEGISAYEGAVEALLNQASARDRWDAKEFWGLVASLVVAAFEAKDPSAFIDRNISKLLKPSPALVVFPVANVGWDDTPRLLGNKCAIGNASAELSEVITRMGGRAASAGEILAKFINQQSHQPPPVCFATLVPGQRNMAFRQASRRFEMLVDTALLLDTDKENHRLHSSRGSWNRPGVRGLMLDRGAVEKGMQRKDAAVELYSHPLIYDEVGRTGSHHWYSAEPVPLHAVLSHAELCDAVLKSLFDSGSIYRRLAVAGKWFSEAFWSSNPDDATLALGVALDALIGAKNGLPGRAMKERFALLEDDPQERSNRAKRYEDLYAVRSRIAHGGVTSKVQEAGFIKGFQREVTWTAWRLIAMQVDFSISSDTDLESTLENLRWSTMSWPTGGKGKEVGAMLRRQAEDGKESTDLRPCGSQIRAPK
ncbi:hypothetical protein ACIBU0_11395 [Streptomyces sp. NPDC049627]|uniref:hypothetical protein n=1 Tax=Streptomyces sp. NPDC049627 TaxID=3365595 RepID=UPI0037B7D105